MKKLVIALLLSYSAQAIADCRIAEMLIEKYGISYAGFNMSLPRADGFDRSSWNREDLIYISFKEIFFVSDGFGHNAVVNKALGQALIHRSGGFAGISEWYGPVSINAEASDYATCNSETAHKRWPPL